MKGQTVVQAGSRKALITRVGSRWIVATGYLSDIDITNKKSYQTRRIARDVARAWVKPETSGGS